MNILDGLPAPPGARFPITIGEIVHGTISARLIMGAITMLVVIACVSVHYEALRLMSRELPRSPFPHVRIAGVILGILIAHSVELWIFAITFLVIDGRWGFGTLVGPDGVPIDGDIFDYAYYSVTSYTTLGFGDMTPTGPLRLLTGMEALLGLVLIGWSASFAYLVMQRYWKDD